MLTAMEPDIDKLIAIPPVGINIGLGKFAKSPEVQGIELIPVDWVPPASGDYEMMDLLDGLL